jgi:hypothetical protein
MMAATGQALKNDHGMAVTAQGSVVGLILVLSCWGAVLSAAGGRRHKGIRVAFGF